MIKSKEAIRCPGGLPKKMAVTILGKQPNSAIWALGPDLFIDEVTGAVFI